MRKGFALLASLALISLLTACQVRVVQPTKVEPSPAPSAPKGSVVQPAPATQQPQPGTQPSPAKTPTENKVTKTGVYFGLADNHTIEVSLDGTPAAIRLSEEVKPRFETLKLNKNGKVEVTYYENADKQLVLTEIKPSK